MRILLGSLLVAACAAESPNLATVDQGLRCDDPDFCGTNSPLMSIYGTWEFETTGVRNNQGFAVLGLGKGPNFYGLKVENSRIIGKDAARNVALAGSSLVGARIYLEIRGRQSAIEITGVGRIDEVVRPHDGLETYVLDWGEVIGSPLPGPMAAGSVIENTNVPQLDILQSVCPEPKWFTQPHAGSVPEWDETVAIGMSPYHSLVFEGDRFDPRTRTVDPQPNDDWFNIGCGTSTLAKLRLTRNTLHTSPGWAHVQAALKMLSADYCGGGESFTFPGEPLVWRDRVEMTYYTLARNSDLEARWDENGAVCVFSPRLLRTNNRDASSKFPDLMSAIESECKSRGRALSKCGNTDPLTWDRELVTSANYD